MYFRFDDYFRLDYFLVATGLLTDSLENLLRN